MSGWFKKGCCNLIDDDDACLIFYLVPVRWWLTLMTSSCGTRSFFKKDFDITTHQNARLLVHFCILLSVDVSANCECYFSQRFQTSNVLPRSIDWFPHVLQTTETIVANRQWWYIIKQRSRWFEGRHFLWKDTSDPGCSFLIWVCIKTFFALNRP